MRLRSSSGSCDGGRVDVESHVEASRVGQQGQVERGAARGTDRVVGVDSAPARYSGTGAPRTFEVARSTVSVCCRARRTSRLVGSAAVDTRQRVEARPARCTACRLGRLVDALEPLADAHLVGGNEHPGERERVGLLRVSRAGADGHRGAELVDRRALHAVVAAGRLGGGGDERSVDRSAERLRRRLRVVEGNPQRLEPAGQRADLSTTETRPSSCRRAGG